MTTIFENPELLLKHQGGHLGVSEWIEITQERVNLFADATGDHQWIHVDPERARSGPFGACIAHGYLSLSLVNLFLPQILQVNAISMGINYGADKLRFPAPVRVGQRVRGSGELLGAEQMKGAIQAIVRVSVEIDGNHRPACVVDTISRFYPAKG